MGTETTNTSRFRKPTGKEIIWGMVFVAAMVFFFYQTVNLISTKPAHALFWYGGAILSCETVLSFQDYQGRKGAYYALVLRAITFFVGYAALVLAAP